VRQRIGRELLGGPTEPFSELREEAKGEGGDVLASLAQRRQVDLDDLQPVVEVLAETPFAHLALEVAVGRGDDAHVDGERLGAAHPLEGALLQDPQHLRLRLRGHVADLVEEDRAAVRGLEAPDPARLGAGERPLLVAEQLALDELAADRGAVHRDERALAPGAALVERVCDELLPGAALAADEHGEVGLRDLLDRLEHALHRGARADQVLEAEIAGEPRAQPAVLAGEPRAFERASHDEADLVVVERLGNVVLGPELHRLDRDLLAAVRRDHHHRRLGLGVAGGAQDVHPARPVAQREVGQHQVEMLLGEASHGRRTVVLLFHVVALAAQQAGERQPDRALVLDEEQPSRHRRVATSACSRGSVSTNSVPAPGCECASMRPPWAATSFFEIASPRPVPSAFDV
jgi:hypothetical protein